MPGPWDSAMKDLLRKSPQQFTEWLVEGSTFIDALSIELKRRDTYIHADDLYKVMLQKAFNKVSSRNAKNFCKPYAVS